MRPYYRYRTMQNTPSPITPAQCRMARAALQWTVSDLSDRSKIGTTTINRFELGISSPIPATLTVLRQTFEAAGVEFTNSKAPGVRLHKKGKE